MDEVAKFKCLSILIVGSLVISTILAIGVVLLH
jgi:hypothetical protein